MALTKWDHFGVELPERWRHWLSMDEDPQGWLRVEEVHEDDALVIRVEIPGIDPDKDISVDVTDHTLRISATREERSEDKKNGYRSEFRYGEFRRSLVLPTGVDTDSVKAEYKDGILEVRVPWPAQQEPGSTKVPVARA